MPIITIPKEFRNEEKLVAIPRSDHEEFSVWQEKIQNAKTFRPTAKDKRDLARARANYKRGNFVFLKDL